MTPQQFRASLSSLSLSQTDLARLILYLAERESRSNTGENQSGSFPKTKAAVLKKESGSLQKKEAAVKNQSGSQKTKRQFSKNTSGSFPESEAAVWKNKAAVSAKMQTISRYARGYRSVPDYLVALLSLLSELPESQVEKLKRQSKT